MTLPDPVAGGRAANLAALKCSFQPALPAKSTSRSSSSVSYITLSKRPRGKSSQPSLNHLDKKKAPSEQSNSSPSSADNGLMGSAGLVLQCIEHPEEPSTGQLC